MDKVYYAKRNGKITDSKIDYIRMVDLFVNMYERLSSEFYFTEAIGDYCENKGTIPGKWGSDVEVFIFTKTGIEGLWPINKEEYYSKNENEIFSLIEFLYDYVSKPKQIYECRNWYCHKHCDDYDKNEGKKIYIEEINKIISKYDEGYILTEDGEVHKMAASGLEKLLEEKIVTSDASNIDDRINSAISQFFRFNSTLADKKAAVLSLGGVLEYLKSSGVRLENKDDSDLFLILNRFDLRHHQKAKQQGEYLKEEWYEWFFYTYISSIRFLLKLNK
ncbi:MAG: hypothetical protein E7207_08495 [Clostridium butyricum]|nr:hypothetical protein [Clostridium butyricum]